MIVLDTNVLSEVMKPRPAAEAASWKLKERGSQLYPTTVCEAEIRLGVAALSRDGAGID
jgi:toxin FitB